MRGGSRFSSYAGFNVLGLPEFKDDCASPMRKTWDHG